MPQAAVKRSGSPRGFHFVNLYQCCPRKFYMSYVKGIRNKYMPKPLVLGSAFHEGKAAWYLGKTKKASIQCALDAAKMYKAEIEQKEDYEDILFRVENMLRVWVDTHGLSDRMQFKPLAVEKELIVPIDGTKYTMTMRPDAILLDKVNDLIYILETKTSSFSVRITEEAVAYGDQATTYLWGVAKKTKWRPYAVLPDICYWNKNTRDIRNISCQRGSLVFRSEYQLTLLESSMKQLFMEVNQKVQAVSKGYDPDILFPRNSYYCLSYSHPCEFSELCAQDVKCLKRLPKPFIKVPTGTNIGRTVADIISVQG